MNNKELFPLFNDEDMRILKEIKALCEERNKKDKELGIKRLQIITTKEYEHRRKLGLPCDDYMVLEEFLRKAKT